jgi:hypothetical protein
VMEEGVFKPATVGTPQGGVISPWLANIVLNHLDWQLDPLDTLPTLHAPRSPRSTLHAPHALTLSRSHAPRSPRSTRSHASRPDLAAGPAGVLGD